LFWPIYFGRSTESTIDYVGGGDNESGALTHRTRRALGGIQYSTPPNGGFSSLSSNSYSSKKQRLSIFKGEAFVPHHMQQKKLCTLDIPTNAVAGQCMDIAIADFMHSHMSPFSLKECPKFLKLLKTL
jgi:hypothetical protein